MQQHSASGTDLFNITDRPSFPSSPTEAPPLVVQDVHKRYKTGVWGNRGISLTARPGEILGILGPNGAGKTTLVRQITSELLPTSGEIRVLGHDVVAEPLIVKRLLGIMPQEAALFEHLTVHQHFRIFAKLRGFVPREAVRRADEMISDLDLLDHRNVPADKLSGGLRRRVLVGIAAIAHPPIIVLDEPTTGLDLQSRQKLWSLLGRHREHGGLVLLTTHSMEEAETFCDRVGIIDEGRLLALDTVENLRVGHGFEYKITFHTNEPTADRQTIYGPNDQELVARVGEMGIRQFAVARTTLEDVYLALTGGLGDFDGDRD